MPSNQRHDPTASNTGRRRVLVTAGPTHEPLDSVRYLGNRSSGRLGIEIARAAASMGHEVVLLMGPAATETVDTSFATHRFRTASDLRALLSEHFPACEILIMAAAVADYRPLAQPDAPLKIPRSGGTLTLELESTPDLVAECVARKEPGQIVVGFALETSEQVRPRGREKLARKGVDAIVANSLETMEKSAMSGAVLLTAEDEFCPDPDLPKADFARWLVEKILFRAETGRWSSR